MALPKQSIAVRTGRIETSGFTLIELMIVIATIAIILTLALPVYSNYATRAKVAEALSLGNAAKTAVSAACLENINIAALTNVTAGYGFTEIMGDDSYVRNIQASGPCTDPVITITTKNTGTAPDPVITLTGEVQPASGRIEWRCTSTTPNYLLPPTCRS